MATKQEIKRYQREWLKLIKQGNKIEEKSYQAIKKILQDVRLRIIDNIASSEGYNLIFLERLQIAVDETFVEFSIRAIDQLNVDKVKAFDLGVEMIDNPLKAAGASIQISAMPMISTDVLESQLLRGTQFITKLSKEAAEKINAEILLGVIGEKTPMETIKIVGQSVNKGVFGSVNTRAEAIVRTEINSALNTATIARAEQAAKEIPDMLKYWMHSGKTRNPHKNHVRADRLTNPNHGGTPIKMNKKFNIGNKMVRGPYDAKLGADEIVNCGCRLGFHINETKLITEPQLWMF